MSTITTCIPSEANDEARMATARAQGCADSTSTTAIAAPPGGLEVGPEPSLRSCATRAWAASEADDGVAWRVQRRGA